MNSRFKAWGVCVLFLFTLARCDGFAASHVAAPLSRENFQIMSMASANAANSQALNDLLSHYWSQGNGAGYITATYFGLPNIPAGIDSRGARWERAMFSQFLNDEAALTNNSDLINGVASDWDHLKSVYQNSEITDCSGASDDDAWDALSAMGIYRLTQDGSALAAAQSLITCSYAHFSGPNNSADGLWYSDQHQVTSIYEVGLALAAFEVYQSTGDQNYYNLAMQTRTWIERDLSRSDGLYFTDYDPNNHVPLSVSSPDAPGATFLAGDMGMAVLNARFYQVTGDDSYRARAVAVVNGLIAKELAADGSFENWRDANTDAAFAVKFVNEVLPLSGVDLRIYRAFAKTANVMMTVTRSSDGYYAADWEGGTYWSGRGGFPLQDLMTNVQAADMVLAEAYLQQGIANKTLPENNFVQGNIDSVDVNGLSGWACATGLSTSIQISVYVGGPPDQGGTQIGRFDANQASEVQVAQACSSDGQAYRFSVPWPAGSLASYAGQSVWIYGVSPTQQANLSLAGSGNWTVPEPAPGPVTPPGSNTNLTIMSDLQWSYAGQIPGLNCTQINEPSDPHTWDDNFLCGTRDWGLRWSYAGPINGMICTQLIESSDPDTWNDNYLCAPSNYGFQWSSSGPIAGLKCLLINEPSDPDTWDDNYLCGPN